MAGAGETAALPVAKRLYYEDTYLSETEARVMRIEAPSDEAPNEQRVFVDQTVAHPQGGGQPADVATLRNVTQGTEPVNLGLKSVDGDVAHILPADYAVAVGDTVHIVVDMERRREHAKLHSAGHLLDAAMARAGRSDLVGTKGYHFPDGNANVEYNGSVAAEDRDALVEALNATLREMLAEDIATVVRTDDDTGMRIVEVGGNQCPCGGTHVKNTSEFKASLLFFLRFAGQPQSQLMTTGWPVQEIVVSRIKKVKKTVKLYYSVQ